MTYYISPLRYPGGKSRGSKRIVSLFPDFDEYREPFIGGGSVFFETRTKFNHNSFWINDLNGDLARFWVAVRDYKDKLIVEVNSLRNKYSNNGRVLYDYIKYSYEGSTDLQVAVRYFILNRITFSGLTDSGGFSQESFDRRFTDSSITKLNDVSMFLQNVKVTNLDYSELVSQNGSNVFLFLDPPYFSQRKSKLYGNKGDLHANFDHERFASVIKKCRHKWLITYDDDIYIRGLYQDFEIKEWDLQYGMNQKNGVSKRGNELIITNYKLPSLTQTSLLPIE